MLSVFGEKGRVYLGINRCVLPFPLPFRPPGINRRTSRHPPGINRRITVPTDHPPGINRGISLSALQVLTERLPDIPEVSTGEYPIRHQAVTGGLPFRSTIPQASTGGYTFPPSRD
ncbi:hypothetical protein Zmor_011227 [Zophobas morio]|uniref:Uncharacterized protein n=1 Tax=Zophobas morio TaxID=2755281 RepID=A0AA38MKR1_9CUCU|nr:hypothetical protein Zmor_011227 [Zophobas morio]